MREHLRQINSALSKTIETAGAPSRSASLILMFWEQIGAQPSPYFKFISIETSLLDPSHRVESFLIEKKKLIRVHPWLLP